MRIIIAGSRTFNDYEYLKESCDIILDLHFDGKPQEFEIVSGHARGADMLGERYATERGAKLTLFPADWSTYGKKAGHIRNEAMAKYAKEDPNSDSMLIAFWDGTSNGTRNMIGSAFKRGFKHVNIMTDWIAK